MLLLKYRIFSTYAFKILNQKQFQLQYLVDLNLEGISELTYHCYY